MSKSTIKNEPTEIFVIVLKRSTAQTDHISIVERENNFPSPEVFSENIKQGFYTNPKSTVC